MLLEKNAPAPSYSYNAAPSKQALAMQYVTLPSKTQPQQMQMTAAAPVKQLSMQQLPAETLSVTPGATLATQTLPEMRTQTSETLPVQKLEPLAPQTLQPQMRQQIINQDVSSCSAHAVVLAAMLVCIISCHATDSCVCPSVALCL